MMNDVVNKYDTVFMWAVYQQSLTNITKSSVQISLNLEKVGVFFSYELKKNNNNPSLSKKYLFEFLYSMV